MTAQPTAFALFAYRQEPGCFIHVLLNGLDLDDKGHPVKIILEGPATTLLSDIDSQEAPLPALFKKASERNLIDGYCLACATKLGARDDAETSGLAPLSDMSGHPSVASYIQKGYTVINF
ncbi:DsrE family protein [Desulfoluna butyratoxydans]|uniref:Dsrefh-like n=1 Tax=Desulfoluna butyratoxydans TaxID=231438 RepID=A0A4U8YH83_9BACT|nr:DsrE family protein [Desulfoluna butyratoxydans]VFQ42881.1 dsrefh-like [Desulfoluna butyratoxydans]